MIHQAYQLCFAAALPVVALLAAEHGAAQVQPLVQPPPRLTFEVASIKERDPRAPIGLVGLEVLPGRVLSRCASLNTLLAYAYRLTLSSPVTGAPDWARAPCGDGIRSDTYALQATMPPETTDAQAREMMQSLLAERFKLVVHWETRSLPVYALVISNDGFKLTPSDPKDDPPRAPGSLGCPEEDPGCQFIVLDSAPISALAPFLAGSVGRPVIDRTGLAGTYQMGVLRWAGDTSPTSPLPSLPTALKEQYGLELTSDTGQVDVLVIDHVEKPSPD